MSGGADRFETLQEEIQGRRALVGVMGLGYVGLPLVREFTRSGFRVLGFDIDSKKVDLLNQGKSYIRSIGADLVRSMRDEGAFEATGDFARLAEADALLICVPTPLAEDRTPDMTYVDGTLEQVAAHLRPGQLVVLESTTYPGTTTERMAPVLSATGLELEADYFLAYSPEREDPGNERFTTGKIPKVVGGAGPRSLALAAALYRSVVVEVITVSSCEVAEATKLLENVYRCVNIALINELKVLFTRMGIDVWEVVRAASTKPFGFQPFYPGPGLGGHCIPIDPFYLAWRARKVGFTTRFIELAGEINAGMPGYVVERTREALAARGRRLSGAGILLLGVTYKRNVDDVRESPALELIRLFEDEGAAVSYHDPYVPRLGPMRHYDFDRASVALTPEVLAAADGAVLVTDHAVFDVPWIVSHCRLLVDTRGVAGGCSEVVVKA